MLALVIDALSTVVIGLGVRPSIYQVPLHYAGVAGVDATGAWYTLFYLPLLGLAIVVINLLVVVRVRQPGGGLGVVILATTLVAEVLLLIEAVLFLSKI